MVRSKIFFAFLICFFVSVAEIEGWRTFWKGRRKGGNLAAPHSNLLREELPPDQWFDQKLDHFNGNNHLTWKQVCIRIESEINIQITISFIYILIFSVIM